jgi:hypothetical protein
MLRGITDLLSVLGQIVPFPVLVGVLVVGALLAIPPWLRSVRTRQIKGALRRAARAHGDDARQVHIDQAFERAGTRPRLLVDLVEQALRNGQRDVVRRGLDALEATGRLELEARRLRRKIEPPDPRPRDPLQAIVRVERHLRAGLVVAAREALDPALREHPHDPDLQNLDRRLREAEGPASDATARPA